MKALFLSLSFAAIALSSYAQKFEVGLNAGCGYNGIAHHLFSEGYLNDPIPVKYSKITPAANFKVAYNAAKWQYGLSAGYREISGFLFYWGCFGPVTDNIVFSFVPVQLFVNRTYQTGSFRLYGGLSAGYMNTVKVKPPYPSPYFETEYRKGNGFSGGLQMGADYAFSRHWAINSELSGNYFVIKGMPYEWNGYLALGGTLGVKYRF